jgi:hypothetical protein
VRVRDAGNNRIVDSSDANFTIGAATPFVIVTAPNGGERLYSGKTTNIQWKAPLFNVSQVKIEYSFDNGVSWNVVASNAQNNGSYTWVIPNVTKSFKECKIRVSKADEPFYNDISDGVFEIRPGIVITSPNGNSTLFQSCTASSVTWEGDASTNCKIELSIDSGATWTILNSNFTVSGFKNSFTWTIPNTPSKRSLVRVTDINNPTYSDVSDSLFTIEPSIVLTYPSYGGVFKSGDILTIRWNSTLTSNFYNLDYTTDNGNTWLPIVTNQLITTNSYNWTLPSINTSNLRIRVTDFTNLCKSSTSSLPATVSSSTSSIQLTSVNSGTFNSCTPINITWTSNAGVSSIGILYSINAGQTWNVIASDVAASSGSFTWTLPNISTNEGIVKLVDGINPSNYDVSDNLFTILKTLNINITTNKITPVCNGDQIILNADKQQGVTWSNGQVASSITVSESGSYFATVTQNGCVATSNIINLTFAPKPERPIIIAKGPTSFCQGGSVVLESNQSSGNIWLPNNETTQSVQVTTTGTYYLVYTNQFGCSERSLPIQVTVSPAPSSPVLSSNSPVYSGTDIKLTATSISGATYAWTGPNNFTSNLQNPVISNADSTKRGSYTLVATVNNCQTLPVSINVDVISTNLSFIQGVVKSPLGDSIPDVTLKLTGSMTKDTISSNKGLYKISPFAGGSYTLTPHKNNDKVKNNGVSTLDIILVQSHILNVDSLNTPYKILAADVNESGTITNLDILYMRRLILGIDTSFPGNKLWTFTDANHVFENKYKPFPNPSTKSFISLSGVNTQDFIGIRLGDVNQDRDPLIKIRNSLKDPKILQQRIGSSNSRNIVEFITDTIFISKAEEFVVKFKAKDFKEMLGFQMTLGWDQNEIEFISLDQNPYNIQFNTLPIAKGRLPLIWADPSNKALTLNNDSLIFSLKFKKLGVAAKSNIEIYSDITPTEGYDMWLNQIDFRLKSVPILMKVDAPVLSDNFKLYPNPSYGKIQIEFSSIKDEMIDYFITNQSGQSIGSGTLKGKKGQNKYLIYLKDLGINASGTYYVRMLINGKARIVKLICLEVL